MTKKAQFHGLHMIPIHLEISAGQLQESLTLLNTLEACKNKPYVLDDETINRIIKSHTPQREMLGITLEQCSLWYTQNPSLQQIEDIGKIERYTTKLQKTMDQILFLANHYKDHTIDRILAKGDAELAIDYLLGNLYDPLSSNDTNDDKNSPEPLGPGTHQDFKIFSNPNEQGIKALYQMKVSSLNAPESLLADWYQDYVHARRMLNEFHEKFHEEGLEEIETIAKELGNYDPIDDIPVIQNEAEMNLFHDYFSLYRMKNGKRFVCDWLDQHPTVKTKTNESIVTGYLEARFAVLRLDKNLSHGAIQVVDIFSGKSYVLMDNALNRSKKEGLFFCCSLIDRGPYMMTTGGGILIDGRSFGGKAILTIVLNQLESLKNPQISLLDIGRCVKKIYGFCLRNGALSDMTANDTY